MTASSDTTRSARTWSLHDLAACIPGAVWLREPASAHCHGASIDTRKLQSGQVFFALQGAQVDGHQFVPAAMTQGAAAAVIDARRAHTLDLGLILPSGSQSGLLQVPDVTAALAAAGLAYRRSVLKSAQVIALTGSNGKTTTCRLVAGAFAAAGQEVWLPQSSFNNELGLPLTLLNAPSTSQCVVCEVGTNAPGEIATLGRMLEPDACAILAVGRSHLEGLGSVQGVAKEKASLAASVPVGGLVVANADAPGLLDEISLQAPDRRIVTYGFGALAQRRIEVIELTEHSVRCTIDGVGEVLVPIAGRHSALNAAAAMILATELSVSAHLAAAGIATAKSPPMRLAWETIGQVRVLMDAYNANPDSTLAALEVLSTVQGSRRIAVLGDMLEMGTSGPALHDEVLRAAYASEAVDQIVCIGPLYAAAAQRLSPVAAHDRADRVQVHADATAAWADRVTGTLQAGDAVLIKGSRGMKLERLVDAVRALHASSGKLD